MRSECCKIGSVIERFDLTHGIGRGDVNQYLISRWKGHNEYPETGIRPLKDWFNQKLLRTVYENHNRRAIESRIESEYETLIGDDESKKQELIQDLEVDGIDGEELINNFASTSTMYRHLTECLEEKKEKKQPNKKSDWEEEKIEYIKGTVTDNVESVLKSLENKDRIERGSELDVNIDIMLSCPDCDREVRFERAIKQGHVCKEHSNEHCEISIETPSAANTQMS